ncbi:hypothetical protein PUN28_005711 [Cardiocondyla obscurior]|uniref:Uncharacterized protein n=1 Tax=Cardiocondyla obscurior TaxID=286306 RepID=A0AAW2GA27_9HYME
MEAGSRECPSDTRRNSRRTLRARCARHNLAVPRHFFEERNGAQNDERENSGGQETIVPFHAACLALCRQFYIFFPPASRRAARATQYSRDVVSAKCIGPFGASKRDSPTLLTVRQKPSYVREAERTTVTVARVDQESRLNRLLSDVNDFSSI